jgi:hypothetical protein
MLTGFFEGMRLNYKQAADEAPDDTRGYLRLVFFILFFSIYSLLTFFFDRKSSFFEAILVTVFSCFLLWVTPFANRLVSILILFFWMDLAMRQKAEFEAVSKLFLGPSLVLFVYGVYSARWGY